MTAYSEMYSLSIGSHKLIQTRALHSICTLSQALSIYLYISVSTESLLHAVVTSSNVSLLASSDLPIWVAHMALKFVSFRFFTLGFPLGQPIIP